MNHCLIGFSLAPIIGPRTSLWEVVGPYWPVLPVAMVVAIAATPTARRLAFKTNLLDLPDETVKTHTKPTAYLGGLAVLAAFVVAALVGSALVTSHLGPGIHTRFILGICGGACLAMIVGLIDDIKDISPYHKLLGQAICSLFLIVAGIKPDLYPFFRVVGIELPELLHDTLAYITILFFVLGASNSLNLLDGLDGLCTGVTAIITVGFLLLAIHLATWSPDLTDPQFRPHTAGIIVTLSLAGAALGFLVFNRYPARIFLGDAGSILLGFIIAAIMMLFASYSIPRWWLASIMIFGLPILDTGTALIRRALNHMPLLESDRGHIYDQMVDRGMSLRRTVLLNYVLAAAFVILGLAIAIFVRTRYAIFVDAIIMIACFAFLGVRGYFRMEGLRGAVQADRPEQK